MKLKGINASSRKTTALIKKCFTELLEEKKEIKNITVTELVKRANITRGTFYSHYDNVYDIAKEFESELRDLGFINMMQINSKEDITTFLNLIFNYLKDNEELYKKLLKSNDPVMIMSKLSTSFYDAFKNAFKSRKKDFDIALHFCTDGAVILLIKYFRGESNFTLNEIKEYVNKAVNILL